VSLLWKVPAAAVLKDPEITQFSATSDSSGFIMDRTKPGWRCNHATWFSDYLWAVILRVYSAGLTSPKLFKLCTIKKLHKTTVC